MSIIGLLSAISIFGLQGARESGRDTKRKADLEAIRSALEIYRADCGAYPSNNIWITGNTLPGSGTPAVSCPATNVYIPEIPKDPDSSNYHYHYFSPTRYELCATLEQTPTSPDSCTAGGFNYKVLSP